MPANKLTAPSQVGPAATQTANNAIFGGWGLEEPRLEHRDIAAPSSSNSYVGVTGQFGNGRRADSLFA
jgi:hypothetical protein